MGENTSEAVVSVDVPKPRATTRLIFKNAIVLVAAQVVAAPLSFVANAVMGRYLGADDFGELYLASTLWSFGFLLVDWGQSAILPSFVAKDRSRTGVLLGTGLAWRMMMLPVLYAGLAAACIALHYGARFQVILALIVASGVMWTFSTACHDTIRGFERTDVAAIAIVGQQVLAVLVNVPILILGGRLRAVLAASLFVSAVLTAYSWRALRSVAQSRLAFDRKTLWTLLSDGAPILVLNVSMALQPNVDAVLLSKFAPEEAIGWFAASKKIVGVLVFPLSALVSALYPTLCRLHAEDQDAFRRFAVIGLRVTTALVMPVALCCLLYPDLGVRAFSRRSFAPAADNLRILSAFLLLLYFSMMLGTLLAAANVRRGWAIAQAMCVVVSAVADPLLIPWFQRHYGNGGLGVCVSTVGSEVLMVAAGLWLAPAGILTKPLLRGLGLAALAGGAMLATARALTALTPFIAAPLCVAVYVGSLWALGGIDPEVVAMLRETAARRFARR
jgi:O-antigen/teichoic acid export membrane protein